MRLGFAPMRTDVLALLACPTCRGDLALDERAREGDHVMAGTLTCGGCGTVFPIRDGIPRLIPGSVTQASSQTAERFAAEWKTFDHMATYQEEWLAGWLDPTPKEAFSGKIVLEGGCGKGRHAVVVSDWGAKHLVSLDLGDAVEVAFAHTRERANVHVIQGDLLHPPVKQVFDIAFSVGVIHHLPDPRAGFESLKSVVKPGGRLAVWVYGYESNEWIVRWVNPLRERVTARMPANVLYWLTLPPSAALLGACRLGLSRRSPYFAALAKLPLREVHSIVFDQLVTPIAHYLPEEEVRSWVADLPDATVRWHRRMSWSVSARLR
jgi:uncharacterized protein YbaR (Trm112 family)